MKPYLLLGCALLITTPCIAQETQVIPSHIQEETFVNKHNFPENFAKELSLTQEQQKQAEQLHEKMREEMKPIREEMGKLREKAHQIRETYKTSFEALLTEEQKGKLEQMKPKHPEAFRHHKKRGHFPQP